MSWTLPQVNVPDIGKVFADDLATKAQLQKNYLAELMQARQLGNQQAYQQALQSAAPGLSSDDPTARRNALADLMRAGPEGAKLALPLLQQEREQAMIGSIMGGGAAVAQQPTGQPAQGGGQQQPAGNSWLDKMTQDESGGNPNAANPRSSARGTLQFIDGTWLKFAQARPDLFQGMSRDQILAARANPGLQRMAGEWYAQQNAQDLQSSGYQPTPINLALSHRFGSGGAKAILGAQPGTPIEQAVGPEVVAANPDLKGRTTGNVVSQFAQRFGDTTASGAPTQQASAQPAGESPEALRQRATQLRLIPNQGAQALANSMEQRAQALEQRQFQLSQAQAAVAARREDAQQRTTERRQDMDERARVRREDQEIRRQERLEDRGNANPTYGNSLEGRALGVVEDLSDKIRSGQATADEVRRYQSSVAVLQQEKIAPDGTRITPRLPGYAPGQDEVQRIYGPPASGATPQGAPGQPGTTAPPVAAGGAPGAPAPQAGLPTAAGGVQEGTKTAPESAQKAMLENVQGIGKIDRALSVVEKAPGATGTVAGLLNSIPGGVADNWSPKESVDARAAIADVGSIVIHDRSGAAVTASEFPRLRPFIPAVSDSPEVVKTKLQRFKQEYQSILRDQYEFYGPGQGYRQLPVVEQALGGAGGKSEAKTARSDPAGIL
ncbi:hypothetical protein RQ831_18220 [Roseomonas gilardii]|uniref:Uncharacterized protein n=1 Tax=Roseomonas gilardii TaxID=257708 RepID=A0ABU3MJA6_9PROT|nr:hypothetical protein [Roseomonas gilardii]MDT8332992.1 hypothetical protein [Roseomonas gilardii]